MGRTLADLVATLAADPRHGAVVCDIDGTLAPIAPTPEQATVLPAALPELERLVERYTLVACVTGRPAAQARRGPTTRCATWKRRSCPSSIAPAWRGASAGWCWRCARRWRSTRDRRY